MCDKSIVCGVDTCVTSGSSVNVELVHILTLVTVACVEMVCVLKIVTIECVYV